MIKKHTFIIILSLFIVKISFSQVVDNSSQVIEELIEDIAESSDEDVDYTTLFDNLNFFLQNPLNINNATREDLEKLQFLNDIQIEEILTYRFKAVGFKTIYEIQLLDGFNAKDISRLVHFVKVLDISEVEIPSLRNVFKYGSHTLFLRTQFVTQQQKGFDDTYSGTKYLGNKYKYYERYQFNYKRNIQFGFVSEKDAGEEFFSGAQKAGFDYYTAHLFIRNIGKIKSLAIGDYKARFGQGLVSWTGLTTNKSSYVTDIRKTGEGLAKYSSTDENNFLRGVGTTIRIRNIDVSAFFSYKHIDANLSEADTSSTFEEIATSFQRTGLHRTPSEIEGRNATTELIYGSNIKFRKNNFNIGTTFMNYMFGTELNKNFQAYNQFDFQGSSNFNTSVDYNFSYRGLYFFGEEAIGKNGGIATLNAVTMNIAPQISLSALQRYYQRNYQAYYSAGFGEMTGTSNEKGLYIGAEINPYRSLKISAYFDSYSFPWLKFRTDAPSVGTDYFAQADYSVNRYMSMYVRYKKETKYQNSSIEVLGVNPIVSYTKKQIRYHINYRLSRSLMLKNRVEVANYSNEEGEPETGFLLFQDVSYKPKTLPLKMDVRFAVFDATYNARLYTYETDILYGYSIPALSGKGIRTYLTLKYTVIPDFMDIWLRYALFNYADRDIIGSGLTEIQGNNKSEVKFQIRLKL